MNIKNAKLLAQQKGIIIRVVKEDGKDLPATLDYNPNRVNRE